MQTQLCFQRVTSCYRQHRITSSPVMLRHRPPSVHSGTSYLDYSIHTLAPVWISSPAGEARVAAPITLTALHEMINSNITWNCTCALDYFTLHQSPTAIRYCDRWFDSGAGRRQGQPGIASHYHALRFLHASATSRHAVTRKPNLIMERKENPRVIYAPAKCIHCSYSFTMCL